MQTDKKGLLYFTTFGVIILLTISTTSVAIAAQTDDLTAPAEAAKLTKYSDSTHELIGYCAPYHGKVCKSFITSSQVWYSNVSVFAHSYTKFTRIRAV